MTAIAELNKRAKKSGTEDCKSKLDLSSCSLDDSHVLALFQALAKAPVLAKLDLTKNNITDEVFACHLILSITFEIHALFVRVLTVLFGC
jgi:hypothetical protein